LSVAAAEWMVNHQIKCIGIDSFSVEKYGFKDGLTHKMLVEQDQHYRGSQRKCEKCIGKRMSLVCLPLFLRNIDGSPSRVVVFDMI
jgi:kynurenine formamidase